MPELPPSPSSGPHALIEVARLFLRLGFTAFGGPAAHIAMYQDEVVQRRKWLDERHFLDLLSATQLIPGPNSTEMAIHIGYVRAGWPGLIVAGLCFILPSTAIVLGLAWLYVRYGMLPQTTWLMYGIEPVVIAIILQALLQLGRKILRTPLEIGLGLAVFGLYLWGVSPIPALLGGGLALLLLGRRPKPDSAAAAWLPPLPLLKATRLGPLLAGLAGWNAAPLAAAAAPFSLGLLFWTFLKIGSVLYGSGYVLLAFLQADFVERLGWLTSQQIIDAIAIGQVTPGPVFTSATFIGYLLGGLPGALLATAGIFLPSFVFVLLSNPLIPRLRRSALASRLLDGVNVASLGLMAGVSLELGRTALVDLLTLAIAGLCLFLLLRYKVNATWLIAAGALVGLARFLLL